jgi:ABC-type Fe3+/spermidine/putrescine transport system ATPase subunit
VIKDTCIAMDSKGSDAPEGSEIVMLVRPEDVVLQERPGANALPCKIQNIHYRGSFYELDVVIGVYLIKAIENKNVFVRDNWKEDQAAFIEFKKYKVFDIREGHGAVREQLRQLGYIE